jgi:hypothetical protein
MLYVIVAIKDNDTVLLRKGNEIVIARALERKAYKPMPGWTIAAMSEERYKEHASRTSPTR